MSPKVQLVVFVLGAAGGEDHRVLWQGLGKLRVVIPALGPAVTAGHDHKLPDGARFDRLHDLVGQGQHLGVGKAAHDLALLDLRGEAGTAWRGR